LYLQHNRLKGSPFIGQLILDTNRYLRIDYALNHTF
jgi:hypothetical protein